VSDEAPDLSADEVARVVISLRIADLPATKAVAGPPRTDILDDLDPKERDEIEGLALQLNDPVDVEDSTALFRRPRGDQERRARRKVRPPASPEVGPYGSALRKTWSRQRDTTTVSTKTSDRFHEVKGERRARGPAGAQKAHGRVASQGDRSRGGLDLGQLEPIVGQGVREVHGLAVGPRAERAPSLAEAEPVLGDPRGGPWW
jgi:hypothetical protein